MPNLEQKKHTQSPEPIQRDAEEVRIELFYQLLKILNTEPSLQTDRAFLDQFVAEMQLPRTIYSAQSNSAFLLLENRLATSQVLLGVQDALNTFRNGRPTAQLQHLPIPDHRQTIFEAEQRANANPYKATIGTELEFIPSAFAGTQHFYSDLWNKIEQKRKRLLKQKFDNNQAPENTWLKFIKTTSALKGDFAPLKALVLEQMGNDRSQDLLTLKYFLTALNLGKLNPYLSHVLASSALVRHNVFYEKPKIEGYKRVGIEVSLLPSCSKELQLAEVAAVIDLDRIEHLGMHFTIADLQLSDKNPEVMDLLLVAAVSGLLSEEVFEKMITQAGSPGRFDRFHPLTIEEDQQKGNLMSVGMTSFPFHSLRSNYPQPDSNISKLLPYSKRGSNVYTSAVEFRGIYGMAGQDEEHRAKLLSFFEAGGIGLRAKQRAADQQLVHDTQLKSWYVKFMKEVKAVLLEHELVSQPDTKKSLLLSNPKRYWFQKMSIYRFPGDRYEEAVARLVLEAHNPTSPVRAKITELRCRYQQKVDALMTQLETSGQKIH